MKKKTAVQHYGSNYALAKALKINRSAVGRWKTLVPVMQAMRLETLTNGALKFNRQEYK